MLSKNSSRLAPERLPQVVVEIREVPGRPADGSEGCAEAATARRSCRPAPRDRGSASIRRTCCVEHGRIVQLALRRDVQQLVVRNAAPQEERQPRRQLEIADAIDRARRNRGGIWFAAEQELRARENQPQRILDADVEIPVIASWRSDRTRCSVSTSASVTGRRYARRARVERIVLAHGASSRCVRGTADENPAAARRVAGACRVDTVP